MEKGDELAKGQGNVPMPQPTSSITVSDKNSLIRTLSTLENEVHELRKTIREEYASEELSNSPCWDGYVQIGMKKGKNGNQVPNCVPATTSAIAEAATFAAENRPAAPEGFHYMPDGALMPDSAHDENAPRPEAPEGYHYMPDGNLMLDSEHDDEAAAKKKRTAAQTPAPKKDQVKGSSKNKKGSASGSKKITFSKAVEKALSNKVETHNKKASKGRRATLGMLKAVYRRGAGAFSTSYRPGQNRNSWALARVNAFLRLLSSGKPSKAAYVQDNDLLPASHPRSTKKDSSTKPLTADAQDHSELALLDASEYAEAELMIELPAENTFRTAREAILALTEFSDFGYEAEEAIKASWLRAVRNGEDPYRRAKLLSTLTHDSLDADLLPREASENE